MARADYEPLDISSYCNAGHEIFDGQHQELIYGNVLIRGLPFLIGSHDQHNTDNFLVSNGQDKNKTIVIGKKAKVVIIAHRLLEECTHNATVAKYVFNRPDSSRTECPINANFQIGTVPGPFLYDAYIDSKAKLLPRNEGNWDDSGRRPMEALATFSKNYHLWVWENPNPEISIDSLEIIPAGPRFLISAITLGHVDEFPFPKQGSRPTKITIKDPSLKKKYSPLELEIDRGDVSYTQSLPDETVEEFLTEPNKGWGSPQNIRSSPSYANVSATSTATLKINSDSERIGEFKWGNLEENGSLENSKARIELVDPGKNWVRVVVIDDESNKPVPCRIHFRSKEGIPYQPYGHHNHVNSNLGTDNFDIGGDVRLGQITYAYIDGTCEGWLPREEVIVDVARGFEYEPIRTKVRIEPGQQDLQIRIKRWSNMNSEGWFSGDSHVHFLSSQGALTEAQGEDLNVVNLLQSQWGSLFTNTEDFIGAPNLARSGNNIVYVSQENRQHMMGHLILWGLKKPVMPWGTDGLGEAEIGGTLETTLSDWADQCHDQGGTVIAPHIGSFNGELVALTATGRVQGMEMVRMHKQAHEAYYRALNCGYRMPLVGGTDKMSADVTVGLSRTYAHLPKGDEFNYDNWCKAVTSGKTFISSGPIIRLSVNGQPIGSTVEISSPGTIEIEASAESIFPLYRLEIVLSGKVIGSTDSSTGTRKLTLKEKIFVSGHTWIAARCGGPDYFTAGNLSSAYPPSWSRKSIWKNLGEDEDYSVPLLSTHYDNWRRGIFAHTSPIYIACGGDWSMFDEVIAKDMLSVINGSIHYIQNTSIQHKHGTVTHHHGKDNHIQYLKQPFLEAREAIERRLHNGN